MSLTLSTDGQTDYCFFSLGEEKYVKFKVKASRDACIALSSSPCKSEPLWEIVFGEENNSTSVIYENSTRLPSSEFPVTNILSATDWLNVWMRWFNNELKVGLSGEEEGVMSCEHPLLQDVRFIGFKTVGGVGEWIFEGASKKRKMVHDGLHGKIKEAKVDSDEMEIDKVFDDIDKIEEEEEEQESKVKNPDDAMDTDGSIYDLFK